MPANRSAGYFIPPADISLRVADETGLSRRPLVVYLPMRGLKSADAPYVIPDGIITGGFNRLLVLIWAVKKSEA